MLNAKVNARFIVTTFNSRKIVRNDSSTSQKVFFTIDSETTDGFFYLVIVLYQATDF